MANIAAFFDIDGTIYREGLITEVFKKMVTHEIIAPERWTDDVKPAYMAWDRRTGDYDDYLSRMVEIFKEATKGISSEHIELIARKVIEQKGERVYQFTRGEIERHKKEGHRIIAISGSPDALVRNMAEKYQFDDWRGTVYETDEKGIYTGGIIPMWDSKSKKQAILGFEKEYDLNLSECWSYGDTNGDLTMFELTGHPTAVNPTRELLANIRADAELMKRIRVIVERKDVIYHIDPNTVTL
ncbi:MAG: HAD-IB family hydrolase [Solobacterium sp.]|jgi:HAD superfamily hydrolase (TIGR01490 family)|nr:HAD-IB family hydrolase [Solobacterium sp.]MCH4222608.1 HAD-IB family hydrolase [Solobacterium sp.]MCH4266704.1 HAD-IB family hydrolase [Solobacterium sp.]